MQQAFEVRILLQNKNMERSIASIRANGPLLLAFQEIAPKLFIYVGAIRISCKTIGRHIESA